VHAGALHRLVDGVPRAVDGEPDQVEIGSGDGADGRPVLHVAGVLNSSAVNTAGASERSSARVRAVASSSPGPARAPAAGSSAGSGWHFHRMLDTAPGAYARCAERRATR